MRTVKAITSPINNVPNKIEIEGWGTTSFIGFAQILFNNGLIDYKMFLDARKYVMDDSLCSKFVNENPNLFPSSF